MKGILVSKDFKQDSARVDFLELICEITLMGVSPAVYIIRLEFQ